jgi:hypothetical protein
MQRAANFLARGLPLRKLASKQRATGTRVAMTMQSTDVATLKRDDVESIGAVADRITIIVTTSATISNPSTWLLEHVMASLVENEPSLTNARKIIVCDGAISVDTSSSKVKFKSGRISSEQASQYEAYKDLVDELVSNESDHPAFRNAINLRLPSRHGFAFAVRKALESVTTPLVMVVQHDRYLCRAFGMEKLVSFMVDESEAASKGVEYVCLKSNATSDYINYVRSRYQMNIVPYSRTLVSDNDLVPLLFWYDSTHIARTSYYLDFVFGYIKGARGRFKLRTGDFIEDKLGQCQLNTIKAQGMGEHARFGTFLLDDGEEMPIVRHASGRKLEGEIVKKVSLGVGWGGTVSEHPAMLVNSAAVATSGDGSMDGSSESESVDSCVGSNNDGGRLDQAKKFEYVYKSDRRNKPHTPSLKVYLASMAVRRR